MIHLRNVVGIDGKVIDKEIASEHELTIDGEGRLLLLPGVIDPHVHFRTPGHEAKENWITGAKAAIAGGVTMVCDMPNNAPSCITKERMRDKHALIQEQLKQAQIPLRYGLYFGADKRHLDVIPQVTDQAVGIKVFMGSSTGDLLMDDPVALDGAFEQGAKAKLPVAVHAEDEERLQARYKAHGPTADPAAHSQIRDHEAAVLALNLAIDLAKKHGTRLYALHLSTKDEMDCIRRGKREGVDVWAETSPHHLFLDVSAYESLGTRAQMNPPLRTKDNHGALWEAIADGTLDTIGSDHAPHLTSEKDQPYPKAPSGVPGVQTILPLLLTAYHQGKLDLATIVKLTRTSAERLFGFAPNDDCVLVDLDKEQTVCEEILHSKCGWSPYVGMRLKGWPVTTIVQGTVFHVDQLRPVEALI